MRTEQKVKLLVWAVVILAFLNVSTILSIIYHNQQEKRYEESQGPGRGWMSGRPVAGMLGLTADQEEQFRQLNGEFMIKVRSVNEALDAERNELFKELDRPRPDTARCNRISARIGKLHERLKIDTYRFYLHVRQLCNPQQQRQLSSIFASIFSLDSHGFGHGRGRGEGRHRFHRPD